MNESERHGKWQAAKKTISDLTDEIVTRQKTTLLLRQQLTEFSRSGLGEHAPQVVTEWDGDSETNTKYAVLESLDDFLRLEPLSANVTRNKDEAQSRLVAEEAYVRSAVNLVARTLIEAQRGHAVTSYLGEQFMVPVTLPDDGAYQNPGDYRLTFRWSPSASLTRLQAKYELPEDASDGQKSDYENDGGYEVIWSE